VAEKVARPPAQYGSTVTQLDLFASGDDDPEEKPPGDQPALQVRERFYEVLCRAGRDTAFFVGNQAKREHVFSVLGVYWPPRVSR
jgi:hypothetical protein